MFGASVALRPVRGAWRMAGRAERDARRRVVDGGGRVTLAFVDAALVSPYATAVVQRVVDSDLAERAVGRALSGRLVDVVAVDLVRFNVIERVADNLLVRAALERALESPGAERMVGRVVESRVVEEASARIVEDVIGRLRQSPALWALIDDVAQSPAVLDAIAQQSAGFADQVSDELRERTRHADERLERAAWRLFRRRADDGEPAPA